MRRYFQNTIGLAILAGALALTGCASPARISLPEDQRATAAGSSVVALVSQSQINKEFQASNAGAAAAGAVAGIPGIGILLAGLAGAAGGAVDASVNAERAKESEEQVQPLRLALAEYNFDDRFKAALDKELSSDALGMQAATVSKDPAAKIDAQSESSPQLNLATSYSVTQDFGALNVRVLAQQMPRAVAALPQTDDKKKQRATPKPKVPQPIYRNTISFTVSLPVVEGQSDVRRLDSWTQGEGQALAVKWLDTAASIIAQQLARDITLGPDSVKQQLSDKELAPYRLTPKGRILGKVLAQNEEQTVVRMRDGTLNVMVKL